MIVLPKPFHILVVDDETRLLHALEEASNKAGCRCTVFDNVDEALSFFLVSSVDAIVTDLNMPGIDGAGFIGLIRQVSNAPIVIITGNAKGSAKIEARYQNVSLIRKPFRPEELIGRIRFLSMSAGEAFVQSESPVPLRETVRTVAR